jgi:hypothetical protein
MVFNTVMDARHQDHRPAIERIAVVVLVTLLAWGLWQGYGAWLLSAPVAHVL